MEQVAVPIKLPSRAIASAGLDRKRTDITAVLMSSMTIISSSGLYINEGHIGIPIFRFNTGFNDRQNKTINEISQRKGNVSRHRERWNGVLAKYDLYLTPGQAERYS